MEYADEFQRRAGMSVELAPQVPLAQAPSGAMAPGRELLSSMEVRLAAVRRADGSVWVVSPLPAGVFLYGPFLRLPRGRYRLSFACRILAPVQGSHPVLGVEVIAQNRVQRAWRDFNVAEIGSGGGSVTFDVPEALSIEAGVDAPFEFRFSHFGNALIQVTGVTLETLGERAPDEVTPLYRLLGRVRTLPLPGPVRLSPLSISRLKLGRASAILRLPAGTYRLMVSGAVVRPRAPDGPVLDVRVRTRDGVVLGAANLLASDFAGGQAAFAFEVPMDVSTDVGLPRNIDISVRHFRNGWVTLDALDLQRLSPRSVAQDMPVRRAASSARRLGTKNVVIFGNCQGNLVADAFRGNPGFARRFSVKHHFMELPANLHEQGKRDLEECDLLLIQDIQEWEQYPLRAFVPDTLPTVRYPCIRFASLWPFDAFNGPDDKVARNRDLPNFEFTYFDGLLARLRKEIPDQDARFEAYRALSVRGIPDLNRRHAFEEQRLLAMDEKFGGGIGAYILENFRKKQLFYTTAHPNGRILAMLMKQIARELDVRQPIWLTGPLDSLRNLQVPIHPKVAQALNVRWVKEATTYPVKGERVTWEAYFRKYISYYG